MAEFRASRNTQTAPPTSGQPTTNRKGARGQPGQSPRELTKVQIDFVAEQIIRMANVDCAHNGKRKRTTRRELFKKHRLRDDHPLGARYQLDMVTRLALQPDRLFLLTTPGLEDMLRAFAGQPLPRGYKAAKLSRFDGAAVWRCLPERGNARSLVFPVRSITFAIKKSVIAALSARSDKHMISVWHDLVASGWEIRDDEFVRGEQDRLDFAARVQEAAQRERGLPS